MVRPQSSPSLLRFFHGGLLLVSRISLEKLLGQVACHLWVGRAKHPGTFGGGTLGIEVFSVGGWLTHGDDAFDTAADFFGHL